VLDFDGVFITQVSPYSGVSISFGPLIDQPYQARGQSLLLYSTYQTEPYNSLRMYAALFWGETEPNLPPQPFSLLLPADGDTAVRPVPLDWQDASDPNPSDQVAYAAYLSPSEQFVPESTLVVGDLTSSHSLAWPEWDGLVYWWKVRAQDSWGQIRWSNQTFSFRLENYGDVNNDGSIDLEDAVFILNYVLRGGPSPEPLASGDVDGDCEVDLGDVVYLLNYLFKGGSNPVLGCA
jgi:hypothetical protein